MAGYITPDSKYVVDSVIPCYDVDAAMRLKPAAFMDMAQEMAYMAADAMRFGYDELKAEGKAWVLSRFHFRFIDAPRWRDKVSLATWHKGAFGPFYIRDFRMTDESGNPCILGTSSWVILDVESRRMARTSEVMEMIPDSTVCHDNAMENPADRIIMPRGCEPEFAGVHKVEYSDVDLLGHANNARYVVWAMDSLGYDVTSESPISDLYINFNHETLAGDEVELYKFRDGDSFYVEGRVGGRQAFCARIDYHRN